MIFKKHDIFFLEEIISLQEKFSYNFKIIYSLMFYWKYMAIV